MAPGRLKFKTAAAVSFLHDVAHESDEYHEVMTLNVRSLRMYINTYYDCIAGCSGDVLYYYCYYFLDVPTVCAAHWLNLL